MPIDRRMLNDMAREYGLEAEEPSKDEWNFLQNIFDYYREPAREGTNYIRTLIEDLFGDSGGARPFSAFRAGEDLAERERRNQAYGQNRY